MSPFLSRLLTGVTLLPASAFPGVSVRPVLIAVLVSLRLTDPEVVVTGGVVLRDIDEAPLPVPPWLLL